ncbi:MULTISPECIES: transcriptional regulator domain-containing protein [unclassified Ensifer]|uniref:transcriptional regulator domain-containing protein n=1 Tax=unclassified Ensifer TaxID=2633371 RepID=UPI0030104C26
MVACARRKRMRPDTSQWRSSSAYDYVDDLSGPDLAWEWLRRNTDYQQDFPALQRTTTDRQALLLALRRRWGLRFPGCAVTQCDTNHRDVVTGAGYRRSSADIHRHNRANGAESLPSARPDPGADRRIRLLLPPRLA